MGSILSIEIRLLRDNRRARRGRGAHRHRHRADAQGDEEGKQTQKRAVHATSRDLALGDLGEIRIHFSDSLAAA